MIEEDVFDCDDDDEGTISCDDRGNSVGGSVPRSMVRLPIMMVESPLLGMHSWAGTVNWGMRENRSFFCTVFCCSLSGVEVVVVVVVDCCIMLLLLWLDDVCCSSLMDSSMACCWLSRRLSCCDRRTMVVGCNLYMYRWWLSLLLWLVIFFVVVAFV